MPADAIQQAKDNYRSLSVMPMESTTFIDGIARHVLGGSKSPTLTDTPPPFPRSTTTIDGRKHNYRPLSTMPTKSETPINSINRHVLGGTEAPLSTDTPPPTQSSLWLHEAQQLQEVCLAYKPQVWSRRCSGSGKSPRWPNIGTICLGSQRNSETSHHPLPPTGTLSRDARRLDLTRGSPTRWTAIHQLNLSSAY